MSQNNAKWTGNPEKMDNGQWGVRINAKGGTPKIGESVEIFTRTGDHWRATITKVTKKANGYMVYETTGRPAKSADKVKQSAAANTRSGGKKACRECGGAVQSWSQGKRAGLCHDCV